MSAQFDRRYPIFLKKLEKLVENKSQVEEIGSLVKQVFGKKRRTAKDLFRFEKIAELRAARPNEKIGFVAAKAINRLWEVLPVEARKKYIEMERKTMRTLPARYSKY